MSNDDYAWRTADPEVMAAFETYQIEHAKISEKRAALRDEVGRNIYVNRGSGLGSTRITGFERLDSDKAGDLLHDDDCLIVSSYRGQHNGLIVPNRRRKSGKAFAERLAALTTPGLDLPGMVSFYTYGDGFHMYFANPAITVWDGVMYALLHSDEQPIGEQWESIPMSTYHLAKEQADA